jgi:hypothetical protein
MFSNFGQMGIRVKLILSIIILSWQLQAQDCSELKGQWVNELGSVLVVDETTNEGKILGHYASSTGVDGKVFPLEGWVNSNADYPNEFNISFSVRWKGYGSITSWTGYCIEENGESKIKTIWNLVRSGKEYDWERIITNSSTFIKTK